MYIVTKRIKGRYYLYQQETYRVGKKVKTRNKYIGPIGRFLNNVFPDVGQARSIDRYVAAHTEPEAPETAPDAPAAEPGEAAEPE